MLSIKSTGRESNPDWLERNPDYVVKHEIESVKCFPQY